MIAFTQERKRKDAPAADNFDCPDLTSFRKALPKAFYSPYSYLSKFQRSLMAAVVQWSSIGACGGFFFGKEKPRKKKETQIALDPSPNLGRGLFGELENVI